MPNPVLYGPDSQPYDFAAAVSPAPGTGADYGIAQRGAWPLGTQLELQDGRKFRYCLAGGTTLVVGNVITAAAIIATDINMTPAAGAIGDRLITFSHGAATVVLNYFAEGYAVISVTPGGGDTYKIANHLALRNATAGDIVNLAPGNALRRALTATSRLDLMAHAYAGVIQAAATTLTGAPVGVAVAAITNAQFGWLQTRGLVGVLGAGDLVVGANAVSPTGTAGAAGPSAASTSVDIGIVQSLAASAAWSSIYLLIDG